MYLLQRTLKLYFKDIGKSGLEVANIVNKEFLNLCNLIHFDISKLKVLN